MHSQIATIKQEYISMKTFMYSDPSPIPQIGRLYPYFRFDGYTNRAEDKKWNMIVMENDYIKVFVCPDIGGKIWGAIEKSTGKEFLYYNHVVKFRDVAMRGAWTSGGLEYNFGDIGHIPTCATPVDYRIKNNEDGSVSCIVGALDLPSRSTWNVEIRLPKDAAYFETKASWFNNSDVPITYYHWMNAAAKAKGNLEFLYPGNKRIGHGGEIGEWPIDNGNPINFYEKNNFGIYKSYHIINAYSDYFGGYYHDDDFGFGHYSLYDDKPGKKIWIWGLSDQGMIWEDLLTDSDGQYIEYQSGKLFNQAAASSTYTPFKHREFAPYDSDIMKEYWFPLKETKGMVAASQYAVLNLKSSSHKQTLFLSALQNLNDTLEVRSNGKTVLNKKIRLKPLELFVETLDVDAESGIEIYLGDNKLHYTTKSSDNVYRPIQPNKEFNWKSAYGFYIEGLELEKQRRYHEALENYIKSYKKAPDFVPTLNRLALSYYRIMEYNKALDYTLKVLAIDTYSGLANYNYGLINTELGRTNDAKSGFSIASQDIAYRSASYTKLAKLFFIEKLWSKAREYTDKAISYNAFNISAYELQALLFRKEDRFDEALKALEAVKYLDATSLFANAEMLFMGKMNTNDFKRYVSNELPQESYLELALQYRALGCHDEAVTLLKLAPEHPIVLLWLAYLDTKNTETLLQQALNLSVDLVFPHRLETAKILEYFLEENPHWKLKYYLGLVYWGKGLTEQARTLFLDCKEKPDSTTFYLAMAQLFASRPDQVDASLARAQKLNPDDWRLALAIIQRDLEKKAYAPAAKRAKAFLKLYPEVAQFGMSYAKALLGLKKYDACIAFLNSFNVLPYEGATEGRAIYHEACIRAAYNELQKKRYNQAMVYAQQAKLWPKNLGVGKHYDVDERLDNYVIAFILEQSGKPIEANEVYQLVANHQTPNYLNEGSKLYLQLLALQKIGNKSEAETLLEVALKKYENNEYLKWVAAKYHNNSKAVEHIKQVILNADTIIQAYDTKYVDTEFELLNTFLECMM